MPARLEIAKVEEPDVYEVRVKGLGRGEPSLSYRLVVEAEKVENIRMTKWEDRRVEDGRVIFTEAVKVVDSVRAFAPTRASLAVTEDSEVPSFNAVYIDETVEPPKEETLATMQKEYTWYVSPWVNPTVKAGVGIAGIAVATGAITKWLGWW